MPILRRIIRSLLIRKYSIACFGGRAPDRTHLRFRFTATPGAPGGLHRSFNFGPSQTWPRPPDFVATPQNHRALRFFQADFRIYGGTRLIRPDVDPYQHRQSVHPTNGIYGLKISGSVHWRDRNHPVRHDGGYRDWPTRKFNLVPLQIGAESRSELPRAVEP